MKAKVLELEEKLKSYQPDKKLYNKRRNDVLYTLNNGNKNSKPREETLKKYDIKFDKDSGKYI